MVRKYSYFVPEVMKAWVDPTVKDPRAIHHRGYGRFMVAGQGIRLRSMLRWPGRRGILAGRSLPGDCACPGKPV